MQVSNWIASNVAEVWAGVTTIAAGVMAFLTARNRTSTDLRVAQVQAAPASSVFEGFEKLLKAHQSDLVDMRDQLAEVTRSLVLTREENEKLSDELTATRLQNEKLQERLADMSNEIQHLTAIIERAGIPVPPRAAARRGTR